LSYIELLNIMSVLCVGMKESTNINCFFLHLQLKTNQNMKTVPKVFFNITILVSILAFLSCKSNADESDKFPVDNEYEV